MSYARASSTLAIGTILNINAKYGIGTLFSLDLVIFASYVNSLIVAQWQPKMLPVLTDCDYPAEQISVLMQNYVACHAMYRIEKED